MTSVILVSTAIIAHSHRNQNFYISDVDHMATNYLLNIEWVLLQQAQMGDRLQYCWITVLSVHR